jgi:hypothetical protein
MGTERRATNYCLSLADRFYLLRPMYRGRKCLPFYTCGLDLVTALLAQTDITIPQTPFRVSTYLSEN